MSADAYANRRGAVHVRMVPKRSRRVVLRNLYLELKILSWSYSQKHIVAVPYRGHMQTVGVKIGGVEIMGAVLITWDAVGIGRQQISHVHDDGVPRLHAQRRPGL